jgi:hypothetical protein
MGHYLSSVRKRELLSMEAEFYMDDNGTIWFCYAHNIAQRRRVKTETEVIAQSYFNEKEARAKTMDSTLKSAMKRLINREKKRQDTLGVNSKKKTNVVLRKPKAKTPMWAACPVPTMTQMRN